MRNPRPTTLLLAGVAAVLTTGWSSHVAAVKGAPVAPPIILEDARSHDVQIQSALSRVSASAALSYATGSGVKIAVLDGGFDLRHEYLHGHIGTQWDAIDQDDDAQDLGNSIDDDSDGTIDSGVGHGTFVAGVIATCAPDAVIFPIRVLDDECNGTTAALARGINKAVELGADVINMSLVEPTMTTQLEDAVNAAYQAGIVIVISAGDDPDGAFSASYLRNRAIVVGAVDDTLHVASFSPNQSLVDVFAPGVDVVGPIGGATQDSYGTWTGTSFSAPFVSAAAALVKELAPTTNCASMRTRLAAAVNAVPDADPSSRGSIDLLESVNE